MDLKILHLMSFTAMLAIPKNHICCMKRLFAHTAKGVVIAMVRFSLQVEEKHVNLADTIQRMSSARTPFPDILSVIHMGKKHSSKSYSLADTEVTFVYCLK